MVRLALVKKRRCALNGSGGVAALRCNARADASAIPSQFASRWLRVCVRVRHPLGKSAGHLLLVVVRSRVVGDVGLCASPTGAASACDRDPDCYGGGAALR